MNIDDYNGECAKSLMHVIFKYKIKRPPEKIPVGGWLIAAVRVFDFFTHL